MSEKEYDNSNKGATWDVKASRGNAEIGGTKFAAVIVRNPLAKDNQPSHDLFLREQTRDGELIHAALFKETKPGAKRALSGSIAVGGAEYWISCFLNEPDPEKKRPVMGLSFQPKESLVKKVEKTFAPTTTVRTGKPERHPVDDLLGDEPNF